MSEHVTRLTPEGARVVTEPRRRIVKTERHRRLATYEPVHDDPLAVACDRYLEAKGCQLWAHFSIAKVEDRWDAACWLAEQMRAVGELWDEGRWERKVLDKPGAAERVDEIEDELRAESSTGPSR